MKAWKRSDISDRAVCLAYSRKGTHGPFADDELQFMFPGCPGKVIDVAMERAYDRDLIEYGVSLRSGWLTAEGQDVDRRSCTVDKVEVVE